MDNHTLQRILSELQNNVPKQYRDGERTAYFTALLDMAQRIKQEIKQEA